MIEKGLNFDEQISSGAKFTSTGSANLLTNEKISQRIKIEKLAAQILEFIKNKTNIFISDLVEHFKIGVEFIFEALKILLEKGLIEKLPERG